MKTQNITSFKARTTILSHNNILSPEQIARLKEMGEAIGTDGDSICFNLRNFKKNRIVVACDAKLNSTKKDITINSSIMLHKWFFKPEKYIKKVLTDIKIFCTKNHV